MAYEISSSVLASSFNTQTVTSTATNGFEQGGKFSPDGTKLAVGSYRHGGAGSSDYGIDIYTSSSVSGWSRTDSIDTGGTGLGAHMEWFSDNNIFAIVGNNIKNYVSGASGWAAGQVDVPTGGDRYFEFNPSKTILATWKGTDQNWRSIYSGSGNWTSTADQAAGSGYGDLNSLAWISDDIIALGYPEATSYRGYLFTYKTTNGGSSYSMSEYLAGDSTALPGMGAALYYHTSSNALLVGTRVGSSDAENAKNKLILIQSGSEGHLPASYTSHTVIDSGKRPIDGFQTAPQYGNGDRVLMVTHDDGTDDADLLAIESGSAGWKVTVIADDITGPSTEGNIDISSLGAVVSNDIGNGAGQATFVVRQMIAANPALAASVTSTVGTSGGTVKAGGTENSPTITVTVGSGDLDGDTSLTAAVISDESVKVQNLTAIKKEAGSAGAHFVGDIIRLTPHGTEFNSAVQVQFELDSAPADLTIWKRDSHDGDHTQWYQLPSTYWSASGTTITINTTRFSEYAGLGGINVARTKLSNTQLATLTTTDLVASTSIQISGSSNSFKNRTVAGDDLFLIEDKSNGTTYHISASQMSEYFGGLVNVSASSDNVDMRMTFVSPTDNADIGLAVDAGIKYNPSSNTLKGTNLSGSGTLQIAGNSDMAGTLDVVGLISGSGGIDIGGTADFGAAVNVQGALDVDGATTLDGLTVAEAAVFSSTLSATGLISGSGGIDIGGTADFGAAVNVQGALDVDGATTLDGLTVAEDAAFQQDVVITGDLTVNGDTTVISTTNLEVQDSLILFSSGASGTPANDQGFIFDRGDSDNAAMLWDESSDRFVFANVASASADSTGNISFSAYPVSASLFYGDGSNLLNVGATVAAASNDANDDLQLLFTSGAGSSQTLFIDTGSLSYNAASNTLKGVNLSGSGTLQIAGNSDMAGTLDVVGLISGAAGIDIAGTADFGAAVNVQGALDVDGATTLDGLTVAEAAIFSSTLSATGLISGSGGIDIAGTADFGAAVNVQGALDVDGATTLDGLTVAEAAVFSSTVSATGLISGSGGIDIAGAADFGAAVNAQGAISGSSHLQIAGNSDMAGTLDVVGLISGSGGIDIGGTADFGAAVNIQGALDVDGATTLDGLTVAEAAIMSSTLSVTGLISGSGGMDIAGTADFGAAVNVEGALDVDGATTLDGLTVSEADVMSSTLSVTGLISGSGGMDLAGTADFGGAVNVQGLLSGSSGLDIGGTADFGAAVNVQGALDVDGATTLDALTVSEAVTFTSVAALAVDSNDSTHHILVTDSDDNIVKKESVTDLVQHITGAAGTKGGLQVHQGKLFIAQKEESFMSASLTGHAHTASMSGPVLSGSLMVFLNGLLQTRSGSANLGAGANSIFDYRLDSYTAPTKVLMADALDSDDVLIVRYIQK